MGNKLNDNNTNNGSGGIGFAGLLTIVFITLKLLGVIDWSWVWVLSPIWISIILICVLLIISFCIMHYLDKKDGFI